MRPRATRRHGLSVVVSRAACRAEGHAPQALPPRLALPSLSLSLAASAMDRGAEREREARRKYPPGPKAAGPCPTAAARDPPGRQSAFASWPRRPDTARAPRPTRSRERDAARHPAKASAPQERHRDRRRDRIAAGCREPHDETVSLKTEGQGPGRRRGHGLADSEAGATRIGPASSAAQRSSATTVPS